jgi:hypothetical protein
MRYSPPTVTRRMIRIAVSGQMIAHDMHAVHLDSSKHSA